MIDRDKKIRLYITINELEYLAHILDHFTDYMAYDDRPDHGFGILKGYRDLSVERKTEIFIIVGKLFRMKRRLYDKYYK